MISVALVYYSQTDMTHRLIEYCSEGVRSEQVDCLLHRIDGKEIVAGRFINETLLEKLQDVNAIIFGSPTYMGGPSAQFKAFADATSPYWADQIWADKLAAGITCGSAPNGDQCSTLYYFMTLASQHGMIWAGMDKPYSYNNEGLNRLGSQLGIVAQTTDDENLLDADLHSAFYLGQRVAKLVRRFHN